MTRETSTLVDESRRELLYSFVLDAIREVCGENVGLNLSHLEDAVFDEWHRDTRAREIVRDTLLAYIRTCVEQAKYNQESDARRNLRLLEVSA